MAAAIVAGVSILAIAFMAVFFGKICREGSYIRVCKIVRLDTEASTPPIGAYHEVETEPHTVDSDVSYAPSNVIVMPEVRGHVRVTRARSRKPA